MNLIINAIYYIEHPKYTIMKIGIFTDLHANLPALKKALAIFEKENCDTIVHVGDLIAIGPYPKECMDLAIRQSNMIFIMGNHDHYYSFGIPQPIPSYMSEEEVAHQKWTREQVGDAYISVVQKWEFSKNITLPNGEIINFRHYGLNENESWFGTYVKEPTYENLDKLFEEVKADTIFYGHNHFASHFEKKRKFINLGSAGCWDKPVVRLGILESRTVGFSLKKMFVPYDDKGLMEAFETRQVPARDFITKTFLTRSF